VLGKTTKTAATTRWNSVERGRTAADMVQIQSPRLCCNGIALRLCPRDRLGCADTAMIPAADASANKFNSRLVVRLSFQTSPSATPSMGFQITGMGVSWTN
jgi:hypothetical protein